MVAVEEAESTTSRNQWRRASLVFVGEQETGEQIRKLRPVGHGQADKFGCALAQAGRREIPGRSVQQGAPAASSTSFLTPPPGCRRMYSQRHAAAHAVPHQNDAAQVQCLDDIVQILRHIVVGVADRRDVRFSKAAQVHQDRAVSRLDQQIGLIFEQVMGHRPPMGGAGRGFRPWGFGS